MGAGHERARGPRKRRCFADSLRFPVLPPQRIAQVIGWRYCRMRVVEKRRAQFHAPPTARAMVRDRRARCRSGHLDTGADLCLSTQEQTPCKALTSTVSHSRARPRPRLPRPTPCARSTTRARSSARTRSDWARARLARSSSRSRTVARDRSRARRSRCRCRTTAQTRPRRRRSTGRTYTRSISALA